MSENNTRGSSSGRGRGGSRGGRGGFRGGRGGKNNFPAFDSSKERKKQDDIVVKKGNIRTEINTLKEKEANIKVQLKNLRDEQREISKEVSDRVNKKNEMKNESEKYFDNIKQITNQKKTSRDDLKKLRDRLPISKKLDTETNEEFVKKNYKDIESKIRALEKTMESTKLNRIEEQKILSEIRALAGKKSIISEYESKLNSLDDGLNTKDLKDKVTENKAKMELESSQIKQRLDRKEEIKKQIVVLETDLTNSKNKRAALFKELQTLDEEYEKIRTDLDEKRKQWNKDLQQFHEKQKVEREEYRKKKEEERKQHLLTTIPYEEEIEKCDNLLQYLEGIVKSPTPQKKGKKEALTLSMAVFQAFNDKDIDIPPPLSHEELQSSIDKVKQKKESYLNKQQEHKEKIQKQIEEQQKEKETVEVPSENSNSVVSKETSPVEKEETAEPTSDE